MPLQGFQLSLLRFLSVHDTKPKKGLVYPHLVLFSFFSVCSVPAALVSAYSTFGFSALTPTYQIPVFFFLWVWNHLLIRVSHQTSDVFPWSWHFWSFWAKVYSRRLAEYLSTIAILAFTTVSHLQRLLMCFSQTTGTGRHSHHFWPQNETHDLETNLTVTAVIIT